MGSEVKASKKYGQELDDMSVLSTLSLLAGMPLYVSGAHGL